MSDERITRAYKYRCRLCGTIHNGAIGKFSLSEGQTLLMELQNRESVYRPGAMVCKVEYHNCADGGFGISDIIGFQPEGEHGGN